MSLPGEAPSLTDGDAAQATCRAIRENIEIISRLEEKYRSNRTTSERMADLIGSFAGSFWFVFAHAVFFAAWILINTHVINLFSAWDPYPFMFLNMAVSLEAIFLSTFVLMKQNRMSKRADSRAHLDLQVNLLAEKEMTMVLQMLQLIANKVGVPSHRLNLEWHELSSETPIEALADVIEQKLPQND